MKKYKAASTVKSNGSNRAKAPSRSVVENRNSIEGHIVEWATNGKLALASRQAVRRQQKLGMPITYKKGKDIVKQFADGRIETLGKIKTPKYRFPKGVRILGDK